MAHWFHMVAPNLVQTTRQPHGSSHSWCSNSIVFITRRRLGFLFGHTCSLRLIYNRCIPAVFRRWDKKLGPAQTPDGWVRSMHGVHPMIIPRLGDTTPMVAQKLSIALHFTSPSLAAAKLILNITWAVPNCIQVTPPLRLEL